MPGPPPKDPEARRNRRKTTAGFRQLPWAGRPGDPPPWPWDSTPASADEREEWAELWTLPQAVEWERLRYFAVVARYVRIVVEARMPVANAQVRSEARQLEDRLGLTPMAMMKLRWETDEPIEEEPEEKPKAPRRVFKPEEGP